MKKRMCVWQETILDLERNVHISLCLNAKSEAEFDLIYKEHCENCPHREPVTGKDVVTESLADDIHIESDSRTDEVIEHLLSAHCTECEHFNHVDGTCTEVNCGCAIPIRDLMRNPDTHCELGLW